MALTTVKSDQIQTSVALAGSPTTTTQSASDNSTKVATTAYVETAVANLVASAPAALNTLDELAAALNDDASFSTTITNSIATKLPLAGGTMTGDISMGTNQIIFDNNSQAIQIKDSGGTASYVLYQDNADTLVLGNATNVEKIRLDTAGNSGAVVIDTNGNVGIGTTPRSDTHSSWGQLFIGEKGSLISEILGNSGYYGTLLSDNLYIDTDTGAFANITTDESSLYSQEAGAHRFYSQSSGTAGAAVTLSQKMMIDSSGNVGIGNTSPSSYYSAFDNLVIGTTGANGITIVSSTNQVGTVSFADGTSGDEAYRGYIQYDHTADKLVLGTAGNDRLHIDSSGNVNIGAKAFITNHNTTVDSLQIGYAFNLYEDSYSSGTDNYAVWANNLYYGAGTGNLYIRNDEASRLMQSNGSLIFQTAAAGTAGNAVTLSTPFKIYSDGKVDIKNSGTDKIVRFVNTGSGTQGVTIGTTTGNSAGVGLHVGHSGTKAFLHPYNYAGGAYQQMEIACSDFVLKTNGSSVGMTMDTSRVATFYGDIKINDANDRLLQNGVGREAKGGYINGNQTVSFTVNLTNQSSVHIRCGFNHYGLVGYGCHLDKIYANGSGGISSLTALIDHTTGAGGSWAVNRVDNTNITITKNAGTYAGGGYYYIIVEGANL